MKAEILKMLRQGDGYVSGQQICDELKVSRTAVWKVINQLKEEGYEIEAVRNRGYRIVYCPDLLSEDVLLSHLDPEKTGWKVSFYPETDSTNTRAKAYGESGGEDKKLFVAEMQSAGKGRRGRSWQSPAGSSIYMTLFLRPKMSPHQAPMLTLVMAYSVAMAVRELLNLEVGIKWPNDLVLNQKKICGILTEMAAEVDYISYVVIGVGINVNTESFPEELRQTATSIHLETGLQIDRAEMIARIVKKFDEYYRVFCDAGDLTPILDGYNSILINKGRQVCVLEPGHEYSALALGINRDGELVVKKEDGEIIEVYAGEVSVRGIYGYV